MMYLHSKRPAEHRNQVPKGIALYYNAEAIPDNVALRVGFAFELMAVDGRPTQQPPVDPSASRLLFVLEDNALDTF